jgi:hypothetical protein
MAPADLLRASREERALYEMLGAVYAELAALLADEAADVDPVRVAALDAQADRVHEGLRTLAATLTPQRLGAEPVPAQVQALWRDSAGLAARAAEANAVLRELARRHQARVLARLAEVRAGRKALAGYRGAVPGTRRLADTSA